MQDEKKQAENTGQSGTDAEQTTGEAVSALDLAALTATPENTLQVEAEEERRRRLPPAAQRALAEAEERRAQRQKKAEAKELGGRGGLDPARYGDWEIKGRAIDF